MASAQASEKLSSQIKVVHQLSGDASSAKDLGWVDMSNYRHVMILVTAAALTGVGVTAFKILANDESDGSGSDVEIKAHAVGTAPDAAGDTLMLECTAEEVRAAGEGYQYISANITAANAADNIVCTVILGDARFASDGLTGDTIA